MDANGTFFQLLLGRDDWANCLDSRQRPLSGSWTSTSEGVTANHSGLDWDEMRGEVTLQKRLFEFANPARSTGPSLKDRRGAARDRYGNWYWIDETRQKIQVNSSGTQTTSDFWSSTERDACDQSPASFHALEVSPSTPHGVTLSGLAVTQEHYLVAGVLEPAGLLIFDLFGGAAPLQLLWPATVKFVPFDIAAAADGGVFVLDRDNQRYWPLDRHFNVIGTTPAAPDNEAFQAEDDSLRTSHKNARLVTGIDDDAACPLQIDDPIAIEALPDGTVLVLAGNPDLPSPPAGTFSSIHRYRLRAELGEPASTRAMLERIEDVDQNFSLVGYDFAFVAGDGATSGKDFMGQLCVVEKHGNQAYAFLLSVRGDQFVINPVAEYLPMRLFNGRALVASGKKFYYDLENHWVPLVAQRRTRHVPEATIFTPLATEDDDGPVRRNAFDGREPDCVWHRLMLDACIPPDAEVTVWSRAANDQRELSLADWQPEPRPYLRGNGSELPFAPRATKEIKGHGTWELLFQNARGRYLQLQLRLTGNGQTTPRLRALRAYYPRFSYLHQYLPSVYREDAESASFLDRFLANVEGIYTAVEDRIAAAQMLFDIRATPPEFLDWLASWFGVVLDPSWDEERKRIFIKYAMELFNRRGTIKGLEMALRIALESRVDESAFTDEQGLPRKVASGIRIVEKYRTRFAASVVLGDPTDYAAVPSGLRSTRWLAAETSPRQSDSRPRPSGDNSVITNERRRWQAFLAQRHGDIQTFNLAYGEPNRVEFSDVPLPRDLPPPGPPLDDWLNWIELSGQTNAARQRGLWQKFLARRYRLIAALNRAYETSWPNFETISLPNAAPTRNLAARDWQLFVEVVLAMHERAHQFTVLLPVPSASRDDLAALDDRRARAEQVINLQKPAHTTFAVKFYWTAFRLGEARLGTDTIADRGSRGLSLTEPLVLGRAYISQGYLAARDFSNFLDRQFTGHARTCR